LRWCREHSGRGIRAALLLCAGLASTPAHAVLDNRDRGPCLTAGNFSMRVTNAGILGNAFFNVGLSNDPSFEFPIGTGNEALNYAALWVGALGARDEPMVSGGPLLEFRPTLDPEDHVRLADFGRLGAIRFFDDDGDGRVDEETLNEKDDDGDGETDEDLGLFSQQLAVADYTDDQPEAIRFVYPGGELHRPLGLAVHQEAYAWGANGHDGIAGLKFTITNHSGATLRQVRVGLYADLDSRARDDAAGHVNDRIAHFGYSRTVFEGTSYLKVGGYYVYPNCPPDPDDGRPQPCYSTFADSLPALVDGRPGSGLPVAAVVPLGHTTDPLALLGPAEARRAARAPGRVSFRTSLFANGLLPGRGGPPLNDADRYAALAGTFPGANEQFAADYAILVSCGPFATLAPGQSVQFEAALIAAQDLDSLKSQAANAAVMYHGQTFNQLPDSAGPGASEWRVGETGLNGHEACVEPPPGVIFATDPHCPGKFPSNCQPQEVTVPYAHGQCVWTDADCDECTGVGGFETVERWLEPTLLPPPPSYRTVALDHGVRVEWDNMPEVLFNAGVALLPAQQRESRRFLGYHVWKMADWRDRHSLVSERRRWAVLGTYGPDTTFGMAPLSSVTDSSLDYVRILYEQPLYPVGRHTLTDREALDGFDYFYVVTSRYEVRQRDASGVLRTSVLESPIDTDFDRRVVPRAEAVARPGTVWVVPNPYRAWSDWNRPSTPGDPFTRHIDFMGLPRNACTIKIWTVAGDFVAQLDHDGRSGNGQASWDLVTRNGQEAVSGVYLFTVDSAAGHKVGRFVLIR
jgi:hypothetical protein